MPSGTFLENEDTRYAAALVMKEFVDVIRSYRFSQYGYVEILGLHQELSKNFGISLENLELFRKKQLNIKELFEAGFSL